VYLHTEPCLYRRWDAITKPQRAHLFRIIGGGGGSFFYLHASTHCTQQQIGNVLPYYVGLLACTPPRQTSNNSIDFIVIVKITRRKRYNNMYTYYVCMYTDSIQPHKRGGVHKRRGLMCNKSRRATGRVPATANWIRSTAVTPYYNIIFLTISPDWMSIPCALFTGVDYTNSVYSIINNHIIYVYKVIIVYIIKL